VLLAAAYQVTGAPPAVIDGDVMPARPLELVRQGRFHRVPVLLGTNEQEGNLFAFQGSKAASMSDVKCALTAVFANATAAETLIDVYNAVEKADNRGIVAQVITDFGYACVARELGKGFTDNGMDTWVYAFNRRAKCADNAAVPGAFHSSEIPFVFDNVAEVGEAVSPGCKSPTQDVALGHRVSELWANFAKNLKAEAAWAPFGIKENTLRIDIGTPTALDMMGGYRRGYCDALWPIVEAAPFIPSLWEITSSLQECQKKASSTIVV